MKITEGTRVRIGTYWRQAYSLTTHATVTEVERIGREMVYYVRDEAGMEAAMSRDEITPVPPRTPSATSANVYGVGITETRKVRASVARTPSRPRARRLRVLPPGSDPLPPRS